MPPYPVYQNTDVIYYDEAVKGLEAQLADLAKAEKFIFMEYHAIEDAQAWHKNPESSGRPRKGRRRSQSIL